MTNYKHDFQVGEGVTYSFNGDRYPATVIRVTPTKVVVREDSYKVKEGENGLKEGPLDSEFFENPNGKEREFTYQKGKMLEKGGGPFGLSHGRSFGQNPHF